MDTFTLGLVIGLFFGASFLWVAYLLEMKNLDNWIKEKDKRKK